MRFSKFSQLVHGESELLVVFNVTLRFREGSIDEIRSDPTVPLQNIRIDFDRSFLHQIDRG